MAREDEFQKLSETEHRTQPAAKEPQAVGRKQHPRLVVFLSYHEGDKAQATKINQRLLAARIETWFDEDQLDPGQNRELETRKAAECADVILLCLSGKSQGPFRYSNHVKSALEIYGARAEGTYVLIPAMLSDSALVPFELKHLTPVNLYEEQGWDRLLRVLKNRAQDIGAGIQDTESDAKLPQRSGGVEGLQTGPSSTHATRPQPQDGVMPAPTLKPGQFYRNRFDIRADRGKPRGLFPGL